MYYKEREKQEIILIKQSTHYSKKILELKEDNINKTNIIEFFIQDTEQELIEEIRKEIDNNNIQIDKYEQILQRIKQELEKY